MFQLQYLRVQFGSAPIKKYRYPGPKTPKKPRLPVVKPTKITIVPGNTPLGPPNIGLPG